MFTGAGGLDYGFEATGCFRTVAAVECQKEFCATIRANQSSGLLRRACIIEDDVRSLSPCDVRSSNKKLHKIKGIIGGPPCESYTPIGNQLGRHDMRGALVFEFANWASALNVQFFVMENVPQLATMEHGSVLHDLLSCFEKAGFTVNHQVLNAADYGAATVRKRLFVVGIRGKRNFRFPSPTHCDRDELLIYAGMSPWACVGEAIRGLPKPSESQPGIPQGHVLIHHTPEVRARFASLSPGDWDLVRKRVRLRLDRPSPSLYAGNLSGIRLHIHPAEPRELTNREAARLHGFPDSFLFMGGRVAAGKQIANAVPIPLATAVAAALYTQLTG